MRRLQVPKVEVLIWLLISFCLVVYFLYSFISQQSMISSAGEKNRLRQIDVPRLPAYSKTSTPISDWSLWNLRPPGKGKQKLSDASGAKSLYDVRLFKNVQAIYSLKNPMVRWEFYGVILKNGKSRAVFHNPSLGQGSWISAGLAEDLAPGLRLDEISENRVVISDTESQVGKTWQLRLFSQNEKR